MFAGSLGNAVSRDLSNLQLEVAHEREASARAKDLAERERLRLAHVALDAEAAAERDRAVCAEREAEADSLKDSMTTLSRSHKYYSRQLSLLSRQHAQWISSVSLPSIQHQLTQPASHQNSISSVRRHTSSVGRIPDVATSEAPARARTDDVNGSQSSSASMTAAARTSSAATRAAHSQSSLVMETLRQDMQTFLIANLDVLASGGGMNASPGSLGVAVEAECSSSSASSETLLRDWRQSTSILLPVDPHSLQGFKPKMRRSRRQQRRVRNGGSTSTCNVETAASVRRSESRRSPLCHASNRSASLPKIQPQPQPLEGVDNDTAATIATLRSSSHSTQVVSPSALPFDPGLLDSEKHVTTQSYKEDKYEKSSVDRSPLDWEGWAADASVDDSVVVGSGSRPLEVHNTSSDGHKQSQFQSLSTEQERRSRSPPRSNSPERPRTRDRPRDMLEGVIHTVWERVHGEAEQWVQQAALLARYKGDMARMTEENRHLRHALQEAKNMEQHRQKQLEAVRQETKEEAAVSVVGAEVSTS